MKLFFLGFLLLQPVLVCKFTIRYFAGEGRRNVLSWVLCHLPRETEKILENLGTGWRAAVFGVPSQYRSENSFLSLQFCIIPLLKQTT